VVVISKALPTKTSNTPWSKALGYGLRSLGAKAPFSWSFATGHVIDSSPAVGADGTVYVGSGDRKLYAVPSTSKGLAASNWPMFRKNLTRTGR
jgi:outer membrane protein assembly factor BamB